MSSRLKHWAEALGEDDMASFQNVDHSVPLSELTLRVGDVMLLTKTIDKVAGLVKNARVTAVELRWNAATDQVRPTPLEGRASPSD